MFHVAALVFAVLMFGYLSRCRSSTEPFVPSAVPSSAPVATAPRTAMNHNTYKEFYNFIQDTYALYGVSVLSGDEELAVKKKLLALQSKTEKILQTFSITKRSVDTDSLFYCLSLVTVDQGFTRVFVNHAIVTKNELTREYNVLYSSLESKDSISDGIFPFQEAPSYQNIDPKITIPIHKSLLL